MPKNTGSVLIPLLLASIILILASSGFYFIAGHKPPSEVPSPTPIISKKQPLDNCVPAGCSGEMCLEESEAHDRVTACVYFNKYSCYKKHSTCKRQANGMCGWTQTSGLQFCLATTKN